MNENPSQNEKEITVSDLYPKLSPERQAEARENWLRYLAITKRIFEYICREKPEILTELKRRAMLRRTKNRRI